MKTAEEILKKLKRLNTISLMLIVDLPNDWSEKKKEKFVDKWHYRIEQYKLNLINQFKENVCKEQWINVKNRLPENNKVVLVYAPDCKIIGSILIGCYYKAEKNYSASWTVYDFNNSNLDERVTYWMPLPTAPEPD